MLSFYLADEISKFDLVTILEQVLLLEPGRIGELYDDGEYLVRYEYNSYHNADSFYQEICVFPPDELLLKIGIYNDLILGKRIAEITGQEVIVDDGSDDPYEWILINKEGIFRVEEDGTVGREVGVKIFPSVQYRLSYEKAMQLLPGKDDLLLGKTSNAFPSYLWDSCIMDSP